MPFSLGDFGRDTMDTVDRQKTNGNAVAGCPLRAANVCALAGVYGGRGAHARAARRGKYGHLQPVLRGDAEAAAISRANAPDRRMGHVSAAVCEMRRFSG